ncbi:hypothetical protein V8E54_012090 [Elaphomyces granulatus]
MPWTNYIPDENIEHSLHELFMDAEPSSELNVMPNKVTGEDPNHSILGTVPSLVANDNSILSELNPDLGPAQYSRLNGNSSLCKSNQVGFMKSTSLVNLRY